MKGATATKLKALQVSVIVLAVGCGALLTLGVLERASQAQGGSTIYVAPAGDCGEMVPCYAGPQEAVDAAGEGYIIKLAAGTYTTVTSRACPPDYADPPASGLVAQIVYIDKTLTLRGGYTVTNWTVADSAANPTILDAGGVGRAMFLAGDISPTVEGLFITGGDPEGLGGCHRDSCGGGVFVCCAAGVMDDCRLFGNLAEYGGGLYLQDSDLTLSGSTMVSNIAARGGGVYVSGGGASLAGNTYLSNMAEFGGAVYLYYSSGTVRDSSVISNSVHPGQGGGIALDGSAATVSFNAIISNTSDWGYGGGLWAAGSNATVEGNVIMLNSAEGGGGVSLVSESHATLRNNFITDNASPKGGGLYVNRSSPRLYHNTIARNRGRGGALYVTTSGILPEQVELHNTILASHTLGIFVDSEASVSLEGTLWYGIQQESDGEGTVVTGTVNAYGDPAFVDPGVLDYHIRPDSAAIDQGVEGGLGVDVDGELRPYQAPDLGADEYWPPGVLKGLYLPVVLKRHRTAVAEWSSE